MEGSAAILHTDKLARYSADEPQKGLFDEANPGQNMEDAIRNRIMTEIKQQNFVREAEIFKALGHPVRLKIVYGLLKMGGCNVKNMQACLGLHQATVSQHLIHLKNRGIITSSRQGLEMVYRVADTWATCIVDNMDRKIAEKKEK